MIKTFTKTNINSNLKTSNISAIKPVEYIGVSNAGASVTTLSLPTNTQPGDLVIFMMASDGPKNFNTPTDFTNFFTIQNDGASLKTLGVMNFRFSYRFMPSTLPANIAGITSLSGTLCMAVTLRNVSNPPNFMFTVSSYNSNGNPNDGVYANQPLEDFNFKDGLTLTGCFICDDIAASFSATPSGYTILGPYTGGTSGSGLSAGLGYKNPTSDSTGTVGQWTANTGTDSWFTFSMGFAPKSILQ